MPFNTSFRWLRNGDEAFSAMLKEIAAARESIRLEMYIYSSTGIGAKFRDALTAAAERGVKVRVLLDALGCILLSDAYWADFRKAGGEFRWFNRFSFGRFGVRNHRKNLVCDEQVAFVGGFNIAPEYEGDGVGRGWRDLGLCISGSLAEHLAFAFDEIFEIAENRPKAFPRLRNFRQNQTVRVPRGQLLLSVPGRLRNPLKRSLQDDLRNAKQVWIMCAYFLPTWRIRGQLQRIARNGGVVKLILAGKSDVPLSRLAGRSLYRRMMNSGIQIYEFQPQILHAKMIILDDVVYAGSANLDIRSMHLNYELLVRVADKPLVKEAREIFAADLKNSAWIDPKEWRKSRTFFDRLKERWAHFALARLDPLISRHRWNGL